MTSAMASRCAVHPSRPSVDGCPVCGRGRCGGDAATYGPRGCPTCAVVDKPLPPPAPPTELAVRAAMAAYAVAVVGGWVATQYVRNEGFSLIAPAFVGVATAWAAAAAATPAARRVALAVAAVASVLSAALAFRVYAAGGLSPVHPAGRVLPPYLAAVGGVLLWPLLFAPPRRRHEDADG